MRRKSIGVMSGHRFDAPADHPPNGGRKGCFMDSKIEFSLSALVISAALVMTGCSSGPPNATANDPTTSSPRNPSASSEGTPTPTPVVEHGSGWSPSVVVSEPIPKKWLGGAGWQAPIVGSPTVETYGLKSAVAVLNYDYLKAGGVTTYDKNGNEVGRSPATTELSPKDISAPYVDFLWSKGKPYLMFFQHGSLVPDPSSTKKTGSGKVFTSFDGETGKLLKHGVVSYGDTETRLFIDPLTGTVEENSDPDWRARVDGVDISFKAYPNEMYGRGDILGLGWSFPSSVLNVSGAVGVLAQGDFLSVGKLNKNAETCTVVDVKTGQEPAWLPQLKQAHPDGCMFDLAEVNGRNENISAYNGVLSFRSLDGYTFMSPETGKIVALSKDDTFQGKFVGANGVVYGYSGAVAGTHVPSYLDVNEGAPKTLGDAKTLMPLAVSGDSVAVFRTSKGLAFINPIAP